MTSSPQYNIGALNSYDPNALMNNPYLYMAMMSPNVNFKANPTTQIQAAENTQTVTNDGAIPVTTPTGQGSDGVSLGTTIIGTAIVAGGALWAIKSGKFSQAGKALQKLIGKGESSSSTTALSRLAAVKNGNGELKVLVPNRTKTFAGNQVQAGVNEYGVREAVAASRQAFNPQVSAINSFQVVTPADSYTVFVKDGKITKVVSALMKKDEDVLARLVNAEAKSSDAELLERFRNIVTELGKDAKEADKAILKDIKNIRYTNKFGDDTLKLSMSKYGEEPTLRSFTTLEQFDRSHNAVKAYTPTSSEEVFAGELVNKKGGWFNKQGVLVDGLKVTRCETNIAGAKCYFEGNNLVKIEQGGEVYANNSIGYKEFVKKHEKLINQFKKDVFEDRIASKIPVGAVIGTV